MGARRGHEFLALHVTGFPFVSSHRSPRFLQGPRVFFMHGADTGCAQVRTLITLKITSPTNLCTTPSSVIQINSSENVYVAVYICPLSAPWVFWDTSRSQVRAGGAQTDQRGERKRKKVHNWRSTTVSPCRAGAARSIGRVNLHSRGLGLAMIASTSGHSSVPTAPSNAAPKWYFPTTSSVEPHTKRHMEFCCRALRISYSVACWRLHFIVAARNFRPQS